MRVVLPWNMKKGVHKVTGRKAEKGCSPSRPCLCRG